MGKKRHSKHAPKQSRIEYISATSEFKNTRPADEIDDKLIKFDTDRMREICQAPESWFDNMPKHYNLPKVQVADKGLKWWFFASQAPILAVAHLDSVVDDNHFGVVDFSGERRVYSPNLDDRLGTYIILDLLRNQYGLEYDILLTTGEESGHSSASNFAIKKKYNWIFEFDRIGTDCVMYDYEDIKTSDLVEKYGWRVGLGSFTDICELESLKCKAFNFGVGYHDYHTKYAYAHLPETAWSISNFLKFYADMKDTHLPHKKKERAWSSYPSKHYLSDWTDRNGWQSQCLYCSEWDFLDKDKMCRRCAASFEAEIVDKTGDEEEETSEMFCAINECTRPNCMGVLTCIKCGLTYHGDTILEDSGVCSICAEEDQICCICKNLTRATCVVQNAKFYMCEKCQESITSEVERWSDGK